MTPHASEPFSKDFEVFAKSHEKTFEAIERCQTIHSPYSPTKGSLLFEDPLKRIGFCKERNATVESEQSEHERRTGKSMDFQTEKDVLKKLQILMERNEKLNEVLEKKIGNLKQSMQENVCLRKEIEFLQRKNAEIQLESETNRAKLAVLEKECSGKRSDEAEKSEIISEFKLLIEELEREMVTVRESERENRAMAEKTRQELLKVISEKSREIEELKTEVLRKRKLESQILIFIQENEKMRKVRKNHFEGDL